MTYPDGQVERGAVRVPAGFAATIDFGYVPANPRNCGEAIRGEILVVRGTFWMIRTEVTQADYRSIGGANPNHFRGDDLPVETVTWLDAVAYANALSRRDGLTAAYGIRGGAANQGYDYAGSELVAEVA